VNADVLGVVLQSLAAVPPVLHWFRTVESLTKQRGAEKQFTAQLTRTLESRLAWCRCICGSLCRQLLTPYAMEWKHSAIKFASRKQGSLVP